MKRQILLAFLLFFILSSCKKGGSEQPVNSKELSKDTQEVLAASTILELRQGYKLLTTDEKSALWNAKWNAILKNDSLNLTSKQKDIIKSIQIFVNQTSVSTLTSNPSIGEKFIKDNLEIYQQNFSREQLYLLIECSYYEPGFSINKASQYLGTFSINQKTLTANVVAPPKSCACYYSISCGLSGTCDDGGCNKIAECGLLGTSNCTGTCSTSLDPEV